ncbi:MAG: hypothetical protein ACKOW2_01715 [Sphingobacteriaceae bacterium]
MRKPHTLLLVAIGLLFSTTLNAQIKTDAGTFNKPKAGSLITELTFAPSYTGGGMFSLPSLTNNSDGFAGLKFRKFSSENKAVRLSANVSIQSSSEEGSETEYSLGLGYGIEKHLKGAERLSTYWGYEGSIGISHGFDENDQLTNTFGIGANVFTGFDYYIMPNIYLGVEVSYGLGIRNDKPDGGDGITYVKLAPGVTPFLRLGWKL